MNLIYWLFEDFSSEKLLYLAVMEKLFFILAVAFLLSCTSIERDSVCDEKSIYYNGCVGGVSSSSGSTQTIIPGPPISYMGETYETVVISTQTWFKRNLNYAVTGSKCGNGSTLSDTDTETCNTYGRLYNWATAMAMPEGCNSGSCSSLMGAKHKGICPDGWHISNNADWDKLVRYANGIESSYGTSTAGRYLKAASGWNSNGNGEDKYGFSALPGGHGDDYNGFQNVGGYGYWWSANEYSSYFAYYRTMSYSDELVDWDGHDKSNLYSVRCVMD